jgi:hypothetical protein
VGRLPEVRGHRGGARDLDVLGSFYGPALFSHVRCQECGYTYNGRTGRSNLIPAILFVTIPMLLILTIVLWTVFWIIIPRLSGNV